jgi:putative two-component system hydrogenase maturation factor HypX/HoxX
VFLALACDRVVASEFCVLNPHYKTLALSGSEYHTFLLPKRVGEDLAKKLLDECLPISALKAKEIGMIDEVFSTKDYFKKLEEYCQEILSDEDRFEDMLWDKQDFIEENLEKMEECKKAELKTMYPEFWDEDSEFHQLRYDFVYKICPLVTPKRLKYDIISE